MIQEKNQTKFIIKSSILNNDLFDLIDSRISKLQLDNYLDDYYNLIIKFNSNDLISNDINNYLIKFWRPWYKNYNYEENLELILKIISSQIKTCVENNYVEIDNIYVVGDVSVKNIQITFEKNRPYIFVRKVKSKKIHINVDFYNNVKINKIVDSIEFVENEYIDERNNDKKLFNKILLDKEKNKKISITDLNEENWKQLILKEKITNKELSELYNESENKVTQIRKKFIPSIKHYSDEYIIYEVMLYSMKTDDYYSNFCIPLLEQMKLKNIKYVYEYLNQNYYELYNVEYELRRQKEIEKTNLSGKDYIIPLSGIFLEKLYFSIKNKELDRKIFKNNWFNMYYDDMIFKAFIDGIEKNNILKDYKTGSIYKHPSFNCYQDLYKRLEMNEEQEESLDILTLVPSTDSKSHQTTKKLRKTCIPKDYVKLTKVKCDIGRIGEELVYNYEMYQMKDYPNYQKNIEKTYLKNETAGYDIKSYDYDGNEIYIEVKTNKSNSSNKIKFNISSNEDEFISNNENVYIYYVYDLKEPKLRIIDKKTYLNYNKRVTNYEVNQDIL